MSNGQNLTVKELSKMTGVSASTISRVINHPELVNDETKKQVMKVLEESDFSLKKRRKRDTHIIGLSFSDAQSLFTSTLTSAIEKMLADTPYQLLLFNLESRQNIHYYFSQHLDYFNKMDGLIISAATLDNAGAEFFRTMDTPVVLLQGRCEMEKSFSTNNFLGCQDAAQYLLSRGYTKIGFVGWEPADEHIRDRFMGFNSALQQAGIPMNEQWHLTVPLSAAGGYDATRQLLSRKDHPEVIFFGCDDMAAGGLRYARETHLSVPDDIGFMGFDDLSIAETIGLTTMKQFIEKKSDMAVSYLLQRLSGEIPTAQADEISITPRLVVRSSTR